MRYVAARPLHFHEHGVLRVVEQGAELRHVPDAQLSDDDVDRISRLRRARLRGHDDAAILAFDVGGVPRWLRVPAEARPMADAPVPDTRPGGRAVRR